MDCRRRLIKCVTGFQHHTRLAIDPKFVRPLYNVPKRVMPRVAVTSTARTRLSIKKAHTDFSPRQVGERLHKDLSRTYRGGLRSGYRNKVRRTPRPNGR